MSEVIFITLPGEPRGKGRPRIGKLSNGRPVAFTPSITRNYEAELKFAAIQAMSGGRPIDEPVSVEMLIAFGIPKSMGKKYQALAKDDLLRPTKKPDADNVFKMVDALNGIVWRDDSQIVRAHIERIYSLNPRLEIKVSRWLS
jgi:Holliday junction resolvase RusA-like endonuclease